MSSHSRHISDRCRLDNDRRPRGAPHAGALMMKIVVLALATIPFVAAPLAQPSNRSSKLGVYAAVGEELIVFGVAGDHATLTRQSSVTLPGFVQEAWASPSAPFLYVAWSNGGSSYTGSGVTPVGDRHGVTAFR